MIPARNIIYEAQRTLNDTAGVRVPASDLIIFLNRAQRDIHTARMDTTTTLGVILARQGYIQTVPPEVAQLVDIQALAEGSKRAISKTEMSVLDAVDPEWRSRPPTTEIRHYMHDVTRDNRTFYLFPPAVHGTGMRCTYSAYPKDIEPPTSPGLAWTTVNGAISLADEWQTALLMLTLAYAYMSDLEGVSNQSMAALHLQQASTLLGVEIQSKVAVGPQKKD